MAFRVSLHTDGEGNERRVAHDLVIAVQPTVRAEC